MVKSFCASTPSLIYLSLLPRTTTRQRRVPCEHSRQKGTPKYACAVGITNRPAKQFYPPLLPPPTQLLPHRKRNVEQRFPRPYSRNSSWIYPRHLQRRAVAWILLFVPPTAWGEHYCRHDHLPKHKCRRKAARRVADRCRLRLRRHRHHKLAGDWVDWLLDHSTQQRHHHLEAVGGVGRGVARAPGCWY